MRRPQFSLKTLLWLVVVAAAFFGGTRVEHALQRRSDELAKQREFEALIQLITDSIEPHLLYDSVEPIAESVAP